jgi:hypothetical protein
MQAAVFKTEHVVADLLRHVGQPSRATRGSNSYILYCVLPDSRLEFHKHDVCYCHFPLEYGNEKLLVLGRMLNENVRGVHCVKDQILACRQRYVLDS